jgi:Phage tail assembly chaperone protein, TAC
MSEIELNGTRYRVNRMNVFDQAHVARKVAPIIFSMGKGYTAALAKLPQRPPAPPLPEHGNGAGNGSTEEFAAPPEDEEQEIIAEQNEIMFDTMGPIADVLAKMSDEDVNYVLKKCLTVCSKHNGQNWVPLMRGDNLMFDDIDLATLMQLTMEVVQDNLGPSLRGLLGQASSVETPSQSIM